MTGKNKKMNFPVIKHIRITREQAKNWNPDKIRHQLDINFNGNSKRIDSDRQSNKNQLVDKIVSNMRKSIKNYKIEELRQLDIRTREVKER